MIASKLKTHRRARRKRGLRKRLYGTAERPRLAVHRSLRAISAQLIDDDRGVVLCQASSLDKELRGQVPYGGNVAAAKVVGARLAERARTKGVSKVAFDRSGYRYHGRVKGLADAAREGGLEF